MKEVESFCYLGSKVDRECVVEGADRARVGTAWSKWREMSSLLRNRRIPLKKKTHLYTAFICSTLLYGAESWPLTQRLENSIQSCDRRMQRFMVGVFLRDRVSSSEVTLRFGLKESSDMARVSRLHWLGHVQRKS